MNTLNEHIQSIRIGKGAPDKIQSYLNAVHDAMNAELTEKEMERLVDIFSKVTISKPKQKKARKSAGEATKPKPPRKTTLSGYGLFLKKTNVDLKTQKFPGNNFTQVSVLWRAMTKDEKAGWEEKARQANLVADQTRNIPDPTGSTGSAGDGMVPKSPNVTPRVRGNVDSDMDDSDFIASDESDGSVGSYDMFDGSTECAESTESTECAEPSNVSAPPLVATGMSEID